MGKALIGYAQSTTPGGPSGTSKFFTMGQSGEGGGNDGTATEAQTKIVCGVAGNFTGLTVLADHTGDTATFRKNGANGNQTVTTTANTAVKDSTHTDILGASDTYDLLLTTASNANSILSATVIFQAASGHACHYMSGSCGLAQTISGSAAQYQALGGAINIDATAADRRSVTEVAGNLTNAQAYIAANSHGNVSTFKSYIGGSTGTISVSITGNTTGLFQDTSHSDAVTVGGNVSWQINTGAGGTVTSTFLGGTIIAASGVANDVFGSVAVARSASGTPSYLPIIGGTDLNFADSEAHAALQHGFKVTTSLLRAYLNSNSYSAAATVNLRKNAGSVNQTLTLTAGTTGLFTDNSHTDAYLPTDTIDISVVGGTSGSATIQWTGLTETDTSGASLARSFCASVY